MSHLTDKHPSHAHIVWMDARNPTEAVIFILAAGTSIACTFGISFLIRTAPIHRWQAKAARYQ